MAPGLIITAPASGSGKTVLTIALLRHLTVSGVRVAAAKAGPDYIDPAFHAAATGRPSHSLDAWAMRPSTIEALLRTLGGEADLVLCEGVMGLFDGAGDGRGVTADLAALTGWPVVLVVDAHAMAGSAAAVVRGFATHRDDVAVAGVIFNRVGSEGHARLLVSACAASQSAVGVLGCVPQDPRLNLPERHLGLVQAGECGDLRAFLDGAAAVVGDHVDIAALRALARPDALGVAAPQGAPSLLPPLAQRIAVARDAAFAFCYPAVLEGWRAAGAEILPFSPLADQGPPANAGAVYLPGGYPELHAGHLAAAAGFRDAMRAAAGRGAAVYGECGGYMVLGETLADADGARHRMLGLLPLEASFAPGRATIGYRRAHLTMSGPLGTADAAFRAHEFHVAQVVREHGGEPLFDCTDQAGRPLGVAGRRVGSVMGSFLHLIDAE